MNVLSEARSLQHHLEDLVALASGEVQIGLDVRGLAARVVHDDHRRPLDHRVLDVHRALSMSVSESGMVELIDAL